MWCNVQFYYKKTAQNYTVLHLYIYIYYLLFILYKIYIYIDSLLLYKVSGLPKVSVFQFHIINDLYISYSQVDMTSSVYGKLLWTLWLLFVKHLCVTSYIYLTCIIVPLKKNMYNCIWIIVMDYILLFRIYLQYF